MLGHLAAVGFEGGDATGSTALCRDAAAPWEKAVLAWCLLCYTGGH